MTCESFLPVMMITLALIWKPLKLDSSNGNDWRRSGAINIIMVRSSTKNKCNMALRAGRWLSPGLNTN
jgi:hypothetical protein